MKNLKNKIVYVLMTALFLAIVVVIVLLHRNGDSLRQELNEPYVEKIKPISEERNNETFNATLDTLEAEKVNLSIRDLVSKSEKDDLELNDQDVSIVRNLRVVKEGFFDKSMGKAVLRAGELVFYEPLNYDRRDIFRIGNDELLVVVDRSNNEVRYLNNRLYVRLLDFKDMTEVSKNFGLEIVSTNEKFNYVIYRPESTKEDFMQKYIMMLEDERIDNVELGLSDGAMTTK